MERENPETSMMQSPQQSDRTRRLRELIEEWIPKLAVKAGAALDVATQKTFAAIWLEGLGDLSPDVLRAAFQKTLRECGYWPVKVADIRKHVTHAEGNVEHQNAETAWQYILDVRRVYWNPDMPGGFSRGVPKLSERMAQAARAAGVFREFESLEALNVWSKKNFIESYLRYGELEQDKFLLPDGELKDAIAKLAQQKKLPE